MMWYLFFVVGSWWFLALCALAVIILFFAVENDAPGWAGVTLIIYCAAIALFGDFNVLSWALEHPILTFAYAGSFFVIGAMWSIIKWWFHVRNLRDKYNEMKLEFIHKHKLGIKVTDRIPDSRLGEFAEWAGRGWNMITKPEAGKHKGRIMTWMMYWPFSMIWTLINDPIKKLFKMIYKRIQGLYEYISNSIYSGVDEELAAAKVAQLEGIRTLREDREDNIREHLRD